MNIQKIFEELESDLGNSGIGIICAELERQGYEVAIDGTPVTTEALFEGKHRDIEGKIGPLVFSLSIKGKKEQEFEVAFQDFHDISLHKEGHGRIVESPS